MKSLILILFFFGSAASCSNEVAKHECLSISPDYLNYGENISGEYDQSNEILLTVPDDEVKKDILDYQIPSGKIEGHESVILYFESHDMGIKSKNILSSYSHAKIYFKNDTYTKYIRLYENGIDDNWLLISKSENDMVWIASCRTGGFNRKVTTCDFSSNIENYGVDFSLKNENISLEEEYKSFLERKIMEWDNCS